MKLLYFKTPLARLLLLVLIILEWTVSDCSTTTNSNDDTSSPSTTPPPTQQTTANTKPRPGNVQDVEVIEQMETAITLKWEKVDNISTYALHYNHNGSMKEENVNNSTGESITHVIAGLTAGTKYKFTIITQLEGATSTGYSVEAVTRPLNPAEFRTGTQTETSITLRWRKVDSNSSYILVYNGKHDSVPASEGDDVVHVISNLTSMTTYNFTLFAVFESIYSSGVEHTAHTAPPNVEDVQSVDQNETSITLWWRKVTGINDYILEWGRVDGISLYRLVSSQGLINVSDFASQEGVSHTLSGLTSGARYNFRVFAVFEEISSSGVNFSAATAPRNPRWFQSISQTETNITLQWERVDGISLYRLVSSQGLINVSDFASQEGVSHTLSGLRSGAKYNFSVFAVFENIESSGTEHTAATVPPTVTGVTVTERKTTSVTLMWDVDIQTEWTYVLYFQGENRTFQANNFLSHELSGLQPGTEYSFSVVTNFFELNSKAYQGFIVTKIDCSGVNWHVTDSSIQGEVEGLFTRAILATNKSQIQVRPGGSNVSFTGLYPGATYEISLMYENNQTNFTQCNLDLTILPPALRAHCEYWAAGYSVKIVWNKPPGVWTAVEVNVSGRTLRTGHLEEQYIMASGFQPATTHQVSLTALSGTVRRSEPSVFQCHTDPRGVIAGSVIAVLLFGGLVCLALFVYYRRPNIRKRLFSSGAKQSDKKPKAISAAKFSGHFHRLSENDHMGFTEEYENLDPVGREQTQKAAQLPENKPKNRFVNIMPYDWCRVKLSKSSPDASDYINASYMPGYNSNREYIATQGPLPSTLNDFWQMVWEQGVKGIVMVTNCSEKGRVKCERYWPDVNKPCLYGELLVTTVSEQEKSSWTLRKLTVKHRHTSEEYRVKQFHFTAWPDHGVPLNTQVLIQFRGLVRQHMQTEGASAPTVVHCSAGVGRTGTIIALDVLLQQLQNEKAVGIYAFVHRMRLHRSNMVQTESQYVFLHQCIMDSLQREKTEESVYENSDVIYANATALKQLDYNA